MAANSKIHNQHNVQLHITSKNCERTAILVSPAAYYGRGGRGLSLHGIVVDSDRFRHKLFVPLHPGCISPSRILEFCNAVSRTFSPFFYCVFVVFFVLQKWRTVKNLQWRWWWRWWWLCDTGRSRVRAGSYLPSRQTVVRRHQRTR